MAKSLGRKQDSVLLKLVEERSLAKKKEEEKKKQELETLQVSYLPDDCVTSILLRLPIDSLQKPRFVSKTWYNIITNPKFIDAHLRRSESVLIFVSPNPKQENTNTITVETKLVEPNPIPIFNHPTTTSPRNHVEFLEFKDGKGEIGEYNLGCLGYVRATCMGLVLIDNKLKKGGLVVMNPVTRKMTSLPVGTITSNPHDDSYGFAWIGHTGEYKVVHLFWDVLRYVNCEILTLPSSSTKKPWRWREVNGPSSFGHGVVSAIGALHWPVPLIDESSDHMVSIEVEKEIFQQVPLPRGRKNHDRVVELGGFLGFVVHECLNHIDVWILKSLVGRKVWSKYHSITVSSIIDMVPICCLRIKGDIVFKRSEDGSFYVYDLENQKMRKVEMPQGQIQWRFTSCLPHVNSMVSWMQSDY